MQDHPLRVVVAQILLQNTSPIYRRIINRIVAHREEHNATLHPELGGAIFTADTQPFWRVSTISPSGNGFHWNDNGESHFLIGDAMGQGMVDLLTAP